MKSHINSSHERESDSLNERLDKLTDDIRKLPPKRIEQLEKLVAAMNRSALSIQETAKILDVSPDTIRRAIKAGSLKAFQINERGTYRIPIEEIERFMRGEK